MAIVGPVADTAELELKLCVFLFPSALKDNVRGALTLPERAQISMRPLQTEGQSKVIGIVRNCIPLTLVPFPLPLAWARINSTDCTNMPELPQQGS